MKASAVVSVVPIVLGNAQALTGHFKATCTACVMIEDGCWGPMERNTELRILLQIQSPIKSGVSNLRYGRSVER